MEKYTLFHYQELLKKKGILVQTIHGEEERLEQTVSSVLDYSRDVKKDTLFVCKGASFQEKYLQEAVMRGAIAYVSETAYPAGRSVPCFLVSDVREAMTALAEEFYGDPAKKLRITGITGTKGKTTTSYYVKAILDEWLARQGEKPSALLSSIENFDGVCTETSKLTTPEPIELQRYLGRAVEAGVTCLTMEVSSQALKMNRIGTMQMETGVFLNISNDHISPKEHKDFQDYLESKLLLFKRCAKVCVNLDSPYAAEVIRTAGEGKRVFTFGTKPEADVYGSEIRVAKGRLSLWVRTPQEEGQLMIPMHGIFNAENALAAVSVAVSMGIPLEIVQKSLAHVRVSGRMEEYRSRDQKKTVLVDYAHNRVSFEKLFQAVRAEYPGSPIAVVFGCVGGKAYNRRKELGEVANLYADWICVTTDDPGAEDPRKIAEEVMAAIDCEKKECLYIEDRTEAVECAVCCAPADSVVLVLGKGSERTQKRADGIEYGLSDGERVELALEKYEKGLDYPLVLKKC